jgi:hypothetical protein
MQNFTWIDMVYKIRNCKIFILQLRVGPQASSLPQSEK